MCVCLCVCVCVCLCVCVQVFRALRVSLTCNDLCDILSRLVETVAEQGEDMQVSARQSLDDHLTAVYTSK